MNYATTDIEWVYNGLHLPGTEVTYVCNDNFLLNPPDYGVVCGADGSYNPINSENSNGSCVKGY